MVFHLHLPSLEKPGALQRLQTEEGTMIEKNLFSACAGFSHYW